MNFSVNMFKSVKFYILIFLVGCLAVLLFMNAYVSTRDIQVLEKPMPQASIIYDQNGEIASKLSNSKIEAVSIRDIPDSLKHAVVAVEDKRFYKHAGIDIQGIFRAALRNIKIGGIAEGGSTITQQLTKNIFLTPDRTFKRKIEEAFIALKIERKYSKDEILQMYLNQIYFGEGAWGVQKAAKSYFGKDAHELTLSESALLAALIKAPSTLSPYKNMKGAIERRNTVLRLMEKQGYITKAQMEKAIKEKVELSKQKTDPYQGRYPYYVDHIIDEAIEKYGLTQNEILSGGYKIYTELDQSMQKALENVYKNDQLFPKGAHDALIQSGSVLLNPKTGGVQALVGGRGEHVFRGFNHATHLRRQPGSTMKPLAVYTPALENGFDIYDSLVDMPLDLNGYQPTNYDGQYRGLVSMYDALIHSYNVPPVWLLNEIGLNKGIEAVERFGIPLTEQDKNLSLALGGLNKGVSPLQMASAYSAFPNKGVRVEEHAITKIVDRNGVTIAKWQEKKTRVTTEKVADKMIYMMKGVIQEGTGKSANLIGREVAGKTGSTQVPIAGIDGTKDIWFVGYTPQLVCSIWLGYDKTDENHYLQFSSAKAASIFKEIMSQALEDVPNESFDLPKYKEVQPIIKQKHEKQSHSFIKNEKHHKQKDEMKKWKKEKPKHHKKEKGKD